MRFIIALTALLYSVTALAVTIPSWPAAQGNLKVSNYYTVKVKQGNGTFQTVTTLMTNSQNELMSSTQNNLFKDRTFNFASFSFDPTAGAITVQVIKKNMSGDVTTNAANVEVINSDGSKKKISNTTVEFKLNNPKYVSVNFQIATNQKSYNGHEAIKNMLMIFADPIDSDLTEPSGANKVVYSSSTTQNQMRNADIIVFRNGYHDVVGRFGMSGIQVRSGAKIWLAPGAVVAGNISGVDSNNNKGFNVAPNIEIYGRGMLYMGQHRNNVNSPNSGVFWRPNGSDYNHSGALTEAISLNGSKNVKIRGIIVGDIMWHGIVIGNDGEIDRVKIWGWHGNNDGMRPGDGSMVKNSFIRPVDDAFYAFAMTAENNLIWPSYNGAIVTAGWVGKYNTGGIVVNNTKVIYPEWTGKGNNNGIVASQLGDYQECTDITINNMEVWGDPVAILNLKPASHRDTSETFNGQSSNPGVHKVNINNLTIHGNIKEPSLLESDAYWSVKNVKLNNVKITEFANRYLANSDRSDYTLFEGNNLTNNNYFQITNSDGSTGGDTGTGNISNGTYYLQAAHSGRYVEVAGFNTQNGGNIQQWGGQSGTQKQWIITHIGDGYYKLINGLSGKAMDVANYSMDNGGNIHQWGFSGGNNQLFKLVDQGGGYYSLRNKMSDKCVDVSNLSQDDGANVHQWSCSGSSNQEFKLISTN